MDSSIRISHLEGISKQQPIDPWYKKPAPYLLALTAIALVGTGFVALAAFKKIPGAEWLNDSALGYTLVCVGGGVSLIFGTAAIYFCLKKKPTHQVIEQQQESLAVSPMISVIPAHRPNQVGDYKIYGSSCVFPSPRWDKTTFFVLGVSALEACEEGEDGKTAVLLDISLEAMMLSGIPDNACLYREEAPVNFKHVLRYVDKIHWKEGRPNQPNIEGEKEKYRIILSAAAHNKAENLILSVDCKDPLGSEKALLLKELLNGEFNGQFRQVIFAIDDPSENSDVYTRFARLFPTRG